MFPLCLLLACSGNEAAPSQSGGSPATDKNVGQATANSPTEVPKSPNLVADPTPHKGAVPGPGDPAWFTPNVFPGATVSSSGRTQKDDQGLFATQMLLALPAGTTRQACVDALVTAVSAEVPGLTDQPGKDDRVTLSGSNDRYHVTLVCGEAKGTMSAYLSYRWLRPPV